MEDVRKNVLSELLNASRLLAEAAADGEWEDVAELEMRQRDLLADFFSGNHNKPMTAQMMSGLAHVRLYTDMVLELAKKKRAALAGASDTVKIGKIAVNAYGECSNTMHA